MARLQTVVDECLAVADAFVDISSSTYNELSATIWEDNDKSYPFFLFDKRSIEIAVNRFSRTNLPSRSTYNQRFYFFNTYDESEKSGTTLQAKQDALMVIADQYFAELRSRNASGQNGFYLGEISFVPNDEATSERLIQLTYSVELIVQREDCSLGTFSYAGVEQPTNLICSSNSATSIDISWTDNATAETAYEIWRSSNGSTFALLNTIAANSTSYSDTGLANETPYAYKVRAIDGTNNGKFSSQILCTTDSAGGACADATVENSTQSYQVNVASGGTLVLPDITHVDPQGNNVVTAAQVAFDSTTYKSGIIYKRPESTNQTTIYRTGDDAYHLSNGSYDYTPPAYPNYIAQFDRNAVNPFLTLKNNNAFGNTNRFTDDAGGQTYSNNYAIDHITGLGYYIVPQTGLDWDNAIDATLALTLLGYSDWRITNVKEQLSLFMVDRPDTKPFDYSPFNFSTTGRIFTSTTRAQITTQVWYFQNATISSNRNKVDVGVDNYFLVRNHYT